ncbi:hypothetical protein AQ946_04150 [Burkholderia pseudomallei]|nr:hypothetical protein PTBPS01_23645 [Burkholderia pseudomallei]OMR35876.1 hypothetical protein AQ724_20580 [Burkholderia pseudomallei]OMS50567.1 hypothetical protein AQ743_00535 [Burkholderia pseudomallei]OMS64798.1 hypothetical protein AQ744_21345 [Burkholderia pseudomallei]OMS68488.1 hypothetical protein AQ745_14800 [Burkholderia pseudomallei]
MPYRLTSARNDCCGEDRRVGGSSLPVGDRTAVVFIFVPACRERRLLFADSPIRRFADWGCIDPLRELFSQSCGA